MKDRTPEERSKLEDYVKKTPWKVSVRSLKECVEEHHRPEELPRMIRLWFELNRDVEGYPGRDGDPRTEEESAKLALDIKEIEAAHAMGVNKDWLRDREEHNPICGWIIGAVHFLKDGKRWWLFTAERHDDKAPMVGSIVHAPASKLDIKKLHKIIAYAGGNPKRELLRTGSITQEEHDDAIADGDDDIAEYGQIFYWWKA